MTPTSEPAPTPAPAASIVELAHLTKRYGQFTAVEDVTFGVAPGEILALLGPNGAGKTTTIRMLMGMLVPSAGAARIDGIDCFTDRARVMARVGYLPDEPVFHDHLRGSELVHFCGGMRGMPRREVDERLRHLGQRLAIDDALQEYAVNYSMGMKKKLALAMALLHEPRVLVLDEPTNGLDPIATRALLGMIREVAARGTAVLYSTHLLEQADRLCDRVAILHRGRLAALGAPAELRAQLAAGGSLEDVFFQVARGDDDGDHRDGGAGGAVDGASDGGAGGSRP